MIYEEIPVKTEGSLEYARLQMYILDTPGESIGLKIRKRPMILICPGGGYYKTSYREGEPVAMYFLGKGFHACVLRYSVSPARFPVQLEEIDYAMRIFKEKAGEWKIDTNHIYLHGASAGGHLAASYGALYGTQWVKSKMKPAGILLSYPVITSDERYAHLDSFRNLLGENFETYKEELSIEKIVTEKMPPTFIWHTKEDQTVPVENSLLMTEALKRMGVPVELHIFPKGEHGLSLANELVEREDGSGIQKDCACWIDLAYTWIANQMKKENES